MGKLEYLDALKRALLGLPPEVQARTLADYEQRFVDGEAAGRSELEVGSELEDPKQVALRLRTSAHLEAVEQTRHPVNILRMAVSSVGLAIFNLFMLVPAIVYSALLFTVYVCALAFYLAGIATVASGLAGTNELVLDWPSHYVNFDGDMPSRQLRVDIGRHGINIHPDRAHAALTVPGDDSGDADDSAGGKTDRDSASAAIADASPDAKKDPDEDDDQDRPHPHPHSRVLRGAETVADGTVRITTGMDAQSRTTQSLFGFGLVLGGIGLFLLALVITRYTLIGLKRYLQMNLSLLRGNGA